MILEKDMDKCIGSMAMYLKVLGKTINKFNNNQIIMNKIMMNSANYLYQQNLHQSKISISIAISSSFMADRTKINLMFIHTITCHKLIFIMNHKGLPYLNQPQNRYAQEILQDKA